VLDAMNRDYTTLSRLDRLFGDGKAPSNAPLSEYIRARAKITVEGRTGAR
jgi:hypothetical protein